MAEPNKLSDEVKAFIVSALACYDSPSTVAAAVKAEFGIEVSRQQVEGYDPGKRQGEKLSDKLKTLFEKSRKAFLEDTDDIPIANKAVRLRRLDRMARTSEDRGNYVLASSLIEQAAREMGGAYTNKFEHTGKNGKPLAGGPTIILTGRPDGQPASKAVDRVRKPGD